MTKGAVAISNMHLAKGLEFKAVAAVVCDKDIVPQASLIDEVEYVAALEVIHDTEWRLLNVVCIRPATKLVIAGISPLAKFIAILKNK